MYNWDVPGSFEIHDHSHSEHQMHEYMKHRIFCWNTDVPNKVLSGTKRNFGSLTENTYEQ